MSLMIDRVNGEVEFKYYRDGSLWYECNDGFLFPVPITETGTATFMSKDKGIYFMRWIRLWNNELEKEANV